MTAEPVLNVPLLTKVLDHITANPKEWNQRVFVREATCGTAACVAGWAVIMTGHTLEYEQGECIHGSRTEACREACRAQFARCTADEKFIADVARHELGLTAAQSACLFKGTNDLHDLWALASVFSDGEIQRLDEVSA